MKSIIVLFLFISISFCDDLEKEYFSLVENLKKERSHKKIVNSLKDIYKKAEKHQDKNDFNFDLYISLQIVFDEFFPRYMNEFYVKNDCYLYISSLKTSLNSMYKKDDSFGKIYDSLMLITLKACLFKK